MSSQDHYIGIDVGTGSARACLIDASGDIKALASEAIKLWQPEPGYYVSTFEPPPPAYAYLFQNPCADKPH